MNKTLDREDLIEKMNLGGVPTDVQNQIIAQFGENVLKAVTLEIMSQLSESAVKIFEKLVNENNQKEMEKFLSEKIPNLDQLIKEKTDVQIESIRNAMTE